MGSAGTGSFGVRPLLESLPQTGAPDSLYPHYHSPAQKPGNGAYMPAFYYNAPPQMSGVPAYGLPTPMHHQCSAGPGFLPEQHQYGVMPHGTPIMAVPRYPHFANVSPSSFPPPTLNPNIQQVHQPPGAFVSTPRRTSESGEIPPAPRGPPKKPKRSGYALWVGNLPPTTDISELKDFFSNGCPLIESVFLMAKSHCAFVNYRTERACWEAQVKFKSATFRGRSLVCRMRNETDSSKATPSRRSSLNVARNLERTADEAERPVIVDSSALQDASFRAVPVPATPRVAEKYFVLKSLTVGDLEAAVRRSTWATQPQNEVMLNEAYQEAEKVYLLFSANKSGEYFGYAKMTSPIYRESASMRIPSAERNLQQVVPNPPNFIVTPATAMAPRGRIVDDSTRGTIFWEAERLEDGDTVEVARPESSSVIDDRDTSKVFNVEWLSTARVPFYLTRGLRNPWNANREVKIARDGTEIAPEVGRRLIDLFKKAAERPPQAVLLN